MPSIPGVAVLGFSSDVCSQTSYLGAHTYNVRYTLLTAPYKYALGKRHATSHVHAENSEISG